MEARALAEKRGKKLGWGPRGTEGADGPLLEVGIASVSAIVIAVVTRTTHVIPVMALLRTRIVRFVLVAMVLIVTMMVMVLVPLLAHEINRPSTGMVFMAMPPPMPFVTRRHV